ncbi:hypothetical protein N7532_001217 [Penicillium argentinense]|uniref:Uncharacterized protein n=1 Tax=Penicillium argentinense TaxID=1131581 RepID=A0A9W9G260_9EURO|nr:uncharacterized protein N7532_001217 [Penicillium argentinense]KAJ5110682.1 hypothetical protein N7532_001217 [Penicillium argentinense]
MSDAAPEAPGPEGTSTEHVEDPKPFRYFFSKLRKGRNMRKYNPRGKTLQTNRLIDGDSNVLGEEFKQRLYAWRQREEASSRLPRSDIDTSLQTEKGLALSQFIEVKRKASAGPAPADSPPGMKTASAGTGCNPPKKRGERVRSDEARAARTAARKRTRQRQKTRTEVTAAPAIDGLEAARQAKSRFAEWLRPLTMPELISTSHVMHNEVISRFEALHRAQERGTTARGIDRGIQTAVTHGGDTLGVTGLPRGPSRAAGASTGRPRRSLGSRRGALDGAAGLAGLSAGRVAMQACGALPSTGVSGDRPIHGGGAGCGALGDAGLSDGQDGRDLFEGHDLGLAPGRLSRPTEVSPSFYRPAVSPGREILRSFWDDVFDSED